MLTAERLREILFYNPETGGWHWLVTLSNRAKAFSKAGSLRKRGDITIRIGGIEYKAHRLAWLYMTSEWPPEQVDHRDLDRSHNWWSNLRLANNSQNNANRPGKVGTQTGVKNVSFYPRKSKANPYSAYGSRSQKRVYLGCFPTLVDAERAAFEHAKKEFGEFAHP
jgi:hypothetical protein